MLLPVLPVGLPELSVGAPLPHVHRREFLAASGLSALGWLTPLGTMLARDIATAKERPLLKDLILVFAPILNADGNEKINKDNRPEQAGPIEGVGTRSNAQGLDLNRDRALVVDLADL